MKNMYVISIALYFKELKPKCKSLLVGSADEV